MDLDNACILLEIDIRYIHKISKEELKKKYHKAALKYHPDKNGNTIEATQHFQNIYHAYDYLVENLKYNESWEESFSNTNTNTNNNTNANANSPYIYLLTSFISNILKGNYKEIISSILTTILNDSYNEISNKIFDELDRDTCFEIFNFLNKYKSILHVKLETLESIKNILVKKFANDKIFILNPNLNDLFENNIYKLMVENQMYLVPLWHNELYFDTEDGNEIIVYCCPELPDNISIDENNNLLVTLDIKYENMKEIMERNEISLNLGNQSFIIDPSNLFIRKKQLVRMNKKGISNINEEDIYNTTKKGDIIVTLQFN